MNIGDRVAEVLDDQAQAVAKWAGLLAEIMEDSTRLECGLADMKLECLRLERAGMWPAVPTESWEGRNGRDPLYLRLLFPAGTRGQKRYRVYIGSKPDEIADARRKAANRIRWEEFQREISRLERALRYAEAALGGAQSLVASYRLRDLGTPAAPDPEIVVPKVEAEHG